MPAGPGLLPVPATPPSGPRVMLSRRPPRATQHCAPRSVSRLPFTLCVHRPLGSQPSPARRADHPHPWPPTPALLHRGALLMDIRGPQGESISPLPVPKHWFSQTKLICHEGTAAMGLNGLRPWSTVAPLRPWLLHWPGCPLPTPRPPSLHLGTHLTPQAWGSAPTQGPLSTSLAPPPDTRGHVPVKVIT